MSMVGNGPVSDSVNPVMNGVNPRRASAPPQESIYSAGPKTFNGLGLKNHRAGDPDAKKMNGKDASASGAAC